jgi:hypothetical protein
LVNYAAPFIAPFFASITLVLASFLAVVPPLLAPI